MEPEVITGQVWQHVKKQTLYRIIQILNDGNAADDDNNPPMVHYIEVADNVGDPLPQFARLKTSWYGSFKYVAG